MSQINHINGNFPAQGVENTQPQAVTQAKPNYRNPATLLARLSGMGKFNSPFKPQLVGNDSYLARMTAQFARRPLGNNPAGNLASDMLALADSLANKALDRDDIARLDALRVQAEQDDMPADARNFCNALARATLLRPLTDAIASMGDKTMRTQLADALHGQVDKLFSAQSKVELQQASMELAGMRETFHSLGLLKSEHDVIFMHLNSILSFRGNLVLMMDEVAADKAKLEQGQAPALSLDDNVAKAERLYERATGDEAAPAFARMDLGNIAASAKGLAVALRSDATVRALDLSKSITSMATQARQQGADLEALSQNSAALKSELERKASSLLGEHHALLQGMHATLDGAIHTSQLLREADTLMGRAGVSPQEFTAKAQQFTEAMDRPGLEAEDALRLNDGKVRLDSKISELKLLALKDEQSFSTQMAELAEAIRAPHSNLEELGANVATLKQSLNQKAYLLGNSLAALQAKLTTLECTLKSSQLLREADALRNSANATPAELKDKASQLTQAQSMPGLAKEDKVHLMAGVMLIDSRVFQLEFEGQFTARIKDTTTQIRDRSKGLDAPGKEIAALKTELEQNSGKLRGAQSKRLSAMLDTLDCCLKAGQLTREADILWKAAEATPAELKAKARQLSEATSMPGLAFDDNVALTACVNLLDFKTSQIQSLALKQENDRIDGIRKDLAAATGEASYEPILAAIEERKAALPAAELADNDRASVSATLADLEHQAVVGKFMARLNDAIFDALEKKEGTPSLTEINQELSAAKAKGVDTSTAQSLLEDLSKEHLGRLTALANERAEALKNSARPSEEQLYLEDMANEAALFLLPGDKDSFAPVLPQLRQAQADAIYAKEILPHLKGEALALGTAHKDALRELCLAGACHASLFTMLNGLDASSLTALLDAFVQVQADKASGKAPHSESVSILDAHFLRYPELDDIASTLLKTGDPDYHFDSVRMLRDLKAHMEQDFPSSLRKKLALAGNSASDISFLAEVVAMAAKARLVDKAKLQQIDFSLIQALWYCRKDNEPALTFESFKLDLPAPYNTMPLLQKYMDAGIGGRSALKSLSNSASLASMGMGTRRQLMGFLTEAQAQNIRWAAGMGVKGLYKELGLDEQDSLEGRFPNELEKEKVAGGKDAQAAAASGMVDTLRGQQKKFEEQMRVHAEDTVRCTMAKRLGQDPESVKDISKGSSLAACVLLLHHVLTDTNITDMKLLQNFIMSLELQWHIHLDKGMAGANAFMVSDSNGKKFKEAMQALQSSADKDGVFGGKAFQEARQAMLTLMQDLKLAERAEAVFYFKPFGKQDPEAAVKGKLWHAVANKADSYWLKQDPLRDLYDQKVGAILQQLKTNGVVAGTGHQQNVEMDQASKDAAYLSKESSLTLKQITEKFNKATQERIGKIVSLALCEQVARSEEFNSLDDLQNAYADHNDKLESWGFYRDTLSRLAEMGLPEGVSSLFLRYTLDSMDENFFVDLAKEGQKGVKPREGLANLVEAQMAELQEEGKTLTLSNNTTGKLALSTASVSVVDAGVNIGLAHQNGLSVWKDRDGSYHMTFSNGVEGTVQAKLGVEFQYVIKAVTLKAIATAEAHMQGNVARGCDLSFANATHCQMFLYAMLSGQTCSELFALCEKASLVTKGGLGAGFSLKAEAQVAFDEEEDLLAAELGGAIEGSIEWSREENSELSLRSRKVKGSLALEASASLNLGVLDDNITSFANSLKEKISEKVEGKIDSLRPDAVPEALADAAKSKLNDMLDEKSGTALGALSDHLQDAGAKGEDGVLSAEKSRVFAYEETRTITEKASRSSAGKNKRVLAAYTRVRAFEPENKAEAIDLMHKHKVSPECISAILEEFKDMPANEGFRLELVSNMKASAVDAYNADPKAKIGKGPLELTEVRVITKESYTKEQNFERGPANVSIQRGFIHSHTKSFDAKLWAYERAVKAAQGE